MTWNLQGREKTFGSRAATIFAQCSHGALELEEVLSFSRAGEYS